jgi:hypothetical protein
MGCIAVDMVRKEVEIANNRLGYLAMLDGSSLVFY